MRVKEKEKREIVCICLNECVSEFGGMGGKGIHSK